jgi:nucleoside-diphosphate-sugar epimerase
MRYLVTGASGFIGSNLSIKLANMGHDVRGLVRDISKGEILKENGVTLFKGDITEKRTLLEPMTSMDGVFHTAAWYKIGLRDRALTYRTNVEGTRNVLEVMRELGIPKGVYTSTIGVFSDTKGKVPGEDFKYTGKHISIYDETKWKAHYEVALPMIEGVHLPLTIVMPGLVYGPGDTSIMGALLDKFLKGDMPIGARGAEFCWTYIDDIVDGHIKAMEMGRAGRSYIMGGERASLVEAISLASEITGITPPFLNLPPRVVKAMSMITGVLSHLFKVPQLYDPETLRLSAGVTYLGDNSRAKEELGFTPRSLREGFSQYLPVRMRELGIEQDTSPH